MLIVLRGFVFTLGVLLVVRTVYSVLSTLVLPRTSRDRIAHGVVMGLLRIFRMRLRLARSYAVRDRVMALFAPSSLLLLLGVWLNLVLVGYMGLYWAAGVTDVYQAFRLSGSSLLTLGFENSPDLPTTLLAFSEATLGLMIITLLIAYLPSMYAAFSRREAAVTHLELRAGSPPGGAHLLANLLQNGSQEDVDDFWEIWEKWFTDVAESHTSLSTLVFFRSPQAHNSWVNSAGAVLDAAALGLALQALSNESSASKLLKTGGLALRRIGQGLDLELNGQSEEEPWEQRQDFLKAYQEWSERDPGESGIVLESESEAAWREYVQQRQAYAGVLEALQEITLAPGMED
jgi:hypothetical protein